ncbi:60S ribosomal protein L38 [Agyrium rufum]|nr:60S ribosomal protein L38 [Agyrium rufum]
MPKEVVDIKQFIEICRRKDASSARIKRNRKTAQIKFKVRCQRFLYTLVLKDSDKADKLKQSLPPGMFYSEYPLAIGGMDVWLGLGERRNEG